MAEDFTDWLNRKIALHQLTARDLAHALDRMEEDSITLLSTGRIKEIIQGDTTCEAERLTLKLALANWDDPEPPTYPWQELEVTLAPSVLNREQPGYMQETLEESTALEFLQMCKQTGTRRHAPPVLLNMAGSSTGNQLIRATVNLRKRLGNPDFPALASHRVQTSYDKALVECSYIFNDARQPLSPKFCAMLENFCTTQFSDSPHGLSQLRKGMQQYQEAYQEHAAASEIATNYRKNVSRARQSGVTQSLKWMQGDLPLPRTRGKFNVWLKLHAEACAWSPREVANATQNAISEAHIKSIMAGHESTREERNAILDALESIHVLTPTERIGLYFPQAKIKAATATQAVACADLLMQLFQQLGHPSADDIATHQYQLEPYLAERYYTHLQTAGHTIEPKFAAALEEYYIRKGHSNPEEITQLRQTIRLYNQTWIAQRDALTLQR